MGLSTLGYYFREAFSSMARNTWLTASSISTVTVSLFILGLSLLAILNVDHMAGYLEDSVEISVFLDPEVDQIQINGIKSILLTMNGVSEVEFVSKDRALEEMRINFGEQSGILEGIEEDNPLPDSFRVKTARASLVAEVAGKIQKIKGVEQVRYGQGVVEKLLSLTRWMRMTGLISMIVLGTAAVFLISITIRMSVFTRRQEIGIMKYLGATNWFVRLPFLLEGMFLGLMGALVAVGVLYGVYFSLLEQVGRSLPFLHLVSSKEEVFPVLGGLIALGLFIGALGSVISVHRFLRV